MFLVAALTLTLADIRQLVSIDDAQISNDGSRVAYVQGAPDFGHDRYNDSLRVVSVRGGASQTIVAKTSEIASPRWSWGARRRCWGWRGSSLRVPCGPCTSA